MPPPPHSLLDHLGQWEIFLQSESDLPALIQIALAHAQFETIHPFLDGNGRVGRLLITFLLCEKRILKWPSLYLSYYFKLHRSEYYDHLQATRDLGDWEGWVKFFLNGVATVADQSSDLASKIVGLKELHRAMISDRFDGATAGKALALLDRLYQRPIINAHQAARELNVSYATANNLIAKLETARIVEESTGQKRNRLFHYKEYLDLFADE